MNKFAINGTIIEMNEHDDKVYMKVDTFPEVVFVETWLTDDFSCGDHVSISGFVGNHPAHNKRGYISELIGTHIRYYSEMDKHVGETKPSQFLATGTVKRVRVDQKLNVYLLMDTDREDMARFCTVKCYGRQAKYALNKLEIGSRIAVSGVIEAYPQLKHSAHITCLDLVSMDEMNSQQQAG